MPKRKNQKKAAQEDDEPEVKVDDTIEDGDKPEPQQETTAAPADIDEVQIVPPKEVLYCEICSLPPEYCEFGSSLTKCMKWLEGSHPDLWSKFYSEDALVAKASKLSIEQASKLSKEAIKKENKAEQKAKAEEEKKKDMKILIKRVERTKRKYVTVIQGLEGFGVELKAASKLFAQKFATGASVTKSAPGSPCLEEIVIQGDVAYDVEEMIEEACKKKSGILSSLDVDAIEVVEGKK